MVADDCGDDSAKSARRWASTCLDKPWEYTADIAAAACAIEIDDGEPEPWRFAYCRGKDGVFDSHE